jgi:hypothetical protein
MMASSQARRAAASLSYDMVTTQGREPAVDEQYHVNSTMARVLYHVNSTPRADEQCRVNSTSGTMDSIGG